LPYYRNVGRLYVKATPRKTVPEVQEGYHGTLRFRPRYWSTGVCWKKLKKMIKIEYILHGNVPVSTGGTVTGTRVIPEGFVSGNSRDWSHAMQNDRMEAGGERPHLTSLFLDN
jgi:hypothetical protein